MADLRPSLKHLRVLAGEGDFNIYRLLDSRRVFLFTKCLLTTLAYFKGGGKETSARSVAFVKGPNQFRYFREAQLQLESQLGTLQLYSSSLLKTESNALMLPRISGKAFAHQVALLLIMLLTGNRRFLNIYLLAFSSAMDVAVKIGMRNVEAFVCFNDRPYDVAAIVNALHNRKGCRTIVVQHGLILSQKFYFPSVAKEFWAWGELSGQHYRAWDKEAQLVVNGRYRDDAQNKASDFVYPPLGRAFHILVAPSFFHDEVRDILLKVESALSSRNRNGICVAIKFHPATKMQWRLRNWIKIKAPLVQEETEPMEVLASKYDALVTKNSTSAIDFLLRGKPAFFSMFATNKFPSSDYGFLIADLANFGIEECNPHINKNQARNKFLNVAINV